MSKDSDQQPHELSYAPKVPDASTLCGSGEFLAICLMATMIAFIFRANSAKAGESTSAQFFSCFVVFILTFLIAPFTLPRRRAFACPIAILIGATAWMPGVLFDH